ncbi:hypothetical protein L1049_006736 [Liquidambar formosana]|uniref:Late embryogenesis abundant protein LEA-2 subgroup domain-containing protein n=1 Tax=Liquidambar formosana TaxID=63359 RepID=A0AAP0RG38_LIQFO
MNQKNPVSSNPLPCPPTTTKSSYISQPPLSDYEDGMRTGIKIVLAVIFGIGIVIVAFVMIYFASKVLTTPILPKIRVVSLSVSNFTLSESGIKANWNIIFELFYPENRFEAKLDRINIFLTYKGAILLRAEGKAFRVQRSESYSLGVDLSKDGAWRECYSVENALVNEIEKDRKSGAVSFSMIMETRTNYEDGVHKESYARGTFEGLKVRFDTATTRSGIFINGNDKTIQTVESGQSMVMKLSDPNKKQKP